MSIDSSSTGARYLTPTMDAPSAPVRRCPPLAVGPDTRVRSAVLLRVVLDDQLFLQRNVDLRTLGQLMHQHAQTRPDDLQPTRDRAIAQGLAGNLERQRGQRLLPDIDDVVLGDAVARDVHLLVVHQEVPVADQLTGLTTRAGEPGTVDDVVEPALQDGEQHLTGLAGAAGGLGVVAAELLLHDAVAEARLLLLLQLEQVLAFLDPRTAVLAGRVGAALERLVASDQVDAQATRLTGGGSGITSHCLNLSFPVRRHAAWADGSRCAAAG